MKSRMFGIVSIILLMAMCMTAVPALLTETVEAVAGDTPIHGYVVFENGTGVGAGAAVVAREGAVVYDTTSSALDSNYTVINGDAQEDGDVVTITATITVGSTVYTGSITLTLSFAQTTILNNITVEEADLVPTFNVSVLAFDGDGIGVADVDVSLVSLTGVYYNATTNATGQAVIEVPVGSYAWTAITLEDALNNRSGSLSVVDSDISLNIDMSEADVVPAEFNIFGIDVSRTCLLVMSVMFIAGLVWLFLVIVRRR